MNGDRKAKHSLLSAIMAIALIFSTQMQIASPAMGRAPEPEEFYTVSNGSAAQATAVLPYGKTGSDVSVSPEAPVLKNEYINLAMPDNTDVLTAADILPTDENGVIEIDSTDADKNPEREGVTIVPATVNNVIRDSLPSLISTKIYTFSVSERGVIVYAFNHMNGTEKNCLWYIRLYEEYSPDGSDSHIAYREINRAEYSSIGTSIQSPALGILPGNYRLSVECISGYTDAKYDMLIGFAQDDTYEIECNDTQARYTNLPLNKTINGSASSLSGGASDVDWYMFEITETGYTVLYFNHPIDASSEMPSSVAWRVQLIDADGNEYFKTNSAMNTEAINSGLIGLQPGYYFVSVSSQIFTAVSYSLNVSFTPDESIERELNDTPETATPISVNTEIVGSLTERDAVSDRDYYSFTMENDGFIVLDFIHEALSDQHDGWNITLTSADGKKSYSAVSDWSQAILQSPNLGLPAGDYFIKIDSDGLYRSNIVYRLILLTVQDGTWESEPNDTPETADEIKSGVPINGTLVENGIHYDSDYFLINARNAGNIEISFSHIKSPDENKEGWIISLLDENGNTIASATSDWDSDEITISASIESGKYYILVETGLFFNSNRYILTAKLPD